MHTTLVAAKCGSCSNKTLSPSGYCHLHEGAPMALRTRMAYVPPAPHGLVSAPSPGQLSGVVSCHKCVVRRTRHLSGLCHADRSTATAAEVAGATRSTAAAYPELLPAAGRSASKAPSESWWRRALVAS